MNTPTGFPTAGGCGGGQAMCCVDLSCVTDSAEVGVCIDRQICDGEAVPGFCPGAASIQCCLDP